MTFIVIRLSLIVAADLNLVRASVNLTGVHLSSPIHVMW